VIPMKRVEPAPKEIIIMINNKCFDAIQDQTKSISPSILVWRLTEQNRKPY
jgi:hypothetical protein